MQKNNQINKSETRLKMNKSRNNGQMNLIANTLPDTPINNCIQQQTSSKILFLA
jgi:hypothetical protein